MDYALGRLVLFGCFATCATTPRVALVGELPPAVIFCGHRRDDGIRSFDHHAILARRFGVELRVVAISVPQVRLASSSRMM